VCSANAAGNPERGVHLPPEIIPAAFIADPYLSLARRKEASSSFLKKRTKKLLFS
jgi:hypothetical protein